MFALWEGVYGSFGEAPVSGPGFAGERWRQASLGLAKDTVLRESRGDPLDFSLVQRNAVMPAVVAELRSLTGRARILDVGGGLGTGYTVLRAALLRQMRGISYDVLEVPEIFDAHEALAAGDGLRFVRDFPHDKDDYDIVYMASTLQYIDDWQGFLTSIARLAPKYLLLSDGLAGKIESYVALQNYYESKIASWFLNEEELVSAMATSGYVLELKQPCVPRLLDHVGALPMSNLPAERRIEHAWHYLFRKQ